MGDVSRGTQPFWFGLYSYLCLSSKNFLLVQEYSASAWSGKSQPALCGRVRAAAPATQAKDIGPLHVVRMHLLADANSFEAIKIS